MKRIGITALPSLASSGSLSNAAVATTASQRQPVANGAANAGRVAQVQLDSDQANSRWWKSWPMAVIALASLAIIAAVVMMVWPNSEAKTVNKITPPAPNSMNTDPIPERTAPPVAPSTPGAQTPAPGAGSDPWSAAPQPNGPDPSPADPSPADPDLLNPDPSDPDPALPATGASSITEFATKACKTFTRCLGTRHDDLCEQASFALSMVRATNRCKVIDALATSCLEALENISCDADGTIETVFAGMSKCAAAIKC